MTYAETKQAIQFMIDYYAVVEMPHYLTLDECEMLYEYNQAQLNKYIGELHLLEAKKLVGLVE